MGRVCYRTALWVDQRAGSLATVWGVRLNWLAGSQMSTLMMLSLGRPLPQRISTSFDDYLEMVGVNESCLVRSCSPLIM